MASVLIVGAGGISNVWLRNCKQLDIEVRGVVDLDLQRARAQIEKYELNAFAETELSKALEKADADFVADLTVPDAHCTVTCAALEAGCHVVSEKPMANSMDEARRMVATAETTGKLYMVGQSRRWIPNHEAIRRFLAGETLGPLTTANCDFYIGAHFGGFRAAMESPLILDMAIHQFDLARMMTGKDPVAVYCHEFNPAGSWYAGDAAATAIFEMTDGVVFTFRGSWCAEGFQTSWNGTWDFHCRFGGVHYENNAPPTAVKVVSEEGFRRERQEILVPPVELPEPKEHGGSLVEMLRFLETGRTPQTECHDNIKSLAMVFAAMQSARTKQRVEINV